MKAIFEYLGLVWNGYRLLFLIAMTRDFQRKRFYCYLYEWTLDEMKKRIGYRGRR